MLLDQNQPGKTEHGRRAGNHAGLMHVVQNVIT